MQNGYRDIQTNLICSCTSGTDAVVVITNVKNCLDSVKKIASREYKAINKCLDLVEETKETLKDLLPSAPGK